MPAFAPRASPIGASSYLTERIERAENIHVRYTSAVVGAHGDDHLESVEICDWTSNTRETVPAGALFTFIGASPPTAWLAGDVLFDERGFVLTG
ncbi:MAG: thioredoxin-disulfide reductase, partial [Chloroflexota bacterium]|nr:thioredoxin-disulfide reductase [Chloroflexota bacterium]